MTQLLQFRRIVDHDVGLVGMASEVALVIRLCRIEHGEGLDLGDDGLLEDLPLRQAGNIGLHRPLLLGTSKEHCRPILRAHVRPLTIQLGRVVRDHEEHLQQLLQAHLARIKHHLNRLSVSGAAGAHGRIRGRSGRAAGIP